MSTLQDLSKVLSRKQAILEESAAGVEQQKKSGKQAARERIALLLDGGSFVEQSMLAQDAGVVAGSGTVDGRPVFVFAQDFAASRSAASPMVSSSVPASTLSNSFTHISVTNPLAKLSMGSTALSVSTSISTSPLRTASPTATWSFVTVATSVV